MSFQRQKVNDAKVKLREISSKVVEILQTLVPSGTAKQYKGRCLC